MEEATVANERNTEDEANGSVGYVLRFEVDATYLDGRDVHEAGGRDLFERTDLGGGSGDLPQPRVAPPI